MSVRCYFFRLPTEIRIQIYSYLIPRQHTFIITQERGGPVVVKDYHHKNKQLGECIETALFYVNKQVSCETRELLFATNKFVFRGGVWVGDLYEGFSFPRMNSVGLCKVWRVLTVEAMKSIRHLEIQIHLTKSVAAFNQKTIYDWLCKLTSALVGGHSLDTLHVRCMIGEYSWGKKDWGQFCPREGELMPQPYILEALVPLSGIEHVTIEGVGKEFAAKLGSVMMGNKRKLKELHYPELHYKRRKRNSARHVQYVKMTTRRYYDQQYDWEEIDA